MVRRIGRAARGGIGPRAAALTVVIALAPSPGAAPFDEAEDPASVVVQRVRALVAAELAADWGRVRALGQEAIDAAARLDDEARGRHSDYVAIAEHGIARADVAEGEFVAAVERVERALGSLPRLSDGYRSPLLSTQGLALLELGLPDRAEAAIEAAVQLSAADVADGRGNFGALFNARFAQARHRLAVGRFRDAGEGLDEFALALDWETVGGVIGAQRIARNRATITVLSGTAWFELARGLEPGAERAAGLLRAERALAGALASDGAQAIDRFAAGVKLIELKLFRDDLDAAGTRLALIEAEASRGGFGALPQEERAWLASLAADHAERIGRGAVSARENLHGVFRDLLSEWRRVERSAGVGFLRYRRAHGVLHQLVATGTPREALEVLLEADRLGVLWRACGSPSLGADDVRRALTGDDAGCIVFVGGVAASTVLAFDRDCIVRARLPPRPRMEREIREFNAALTLPPSTLSPGRRERRREDLERHGGWLSANLFPDEVRERLREWRHVRLVTADALGRLVCEALPVVDGRPLGLTHAVSRLPSLSVAAAGARREDGKSDGTGEIWLIGAPRPAESTAEKIPGSGALTLPRELVDAIEEALPRRAVRVYRGEAATIARIEAATPGRVDLLHVVAHGVVDSARELRPMIALTAEPPRDDGWLTVERVRSLRAPPLVLLSVCRTGSGVERIGDAGASDLGGAFLVAGARAVVMSDFDLRLDAATAFDVELYRGLAHGGSVAEAARSARTRIAADPLRSDPIHWALSYVYGLGERGL